MDNEMVSGHRALLAAILRVAIEDARGDEEDVLVNRVCRKAREWLSGPDGERIMVLLELEPDVVRSRLKAGWNVN